MKATIDSSRRRFFRKAGAALSAPLAVVADSASAAPTADADALRARLALLEDVEAIRALNRECARRLSAGAHGEAAELFVEPAQAPIDGRIRSLTPDAAGGDDDIEIGPDGATASARLHFTAEIETPIEPACPLVEMARAQGGGVTRRRARGVLEAAYAKSDGVWKIERWSFREA